MKEMPEKWRYIMPLRDGSLTPGRIEHTENSKLVHRIDFRDKDVLDVGCWDGPFTLIALQKGAKEVTCIDTVVRPTIQFIKDHYEFKNMYIKQASVYDFNPRRKYDVVLFFGVYYHLSDPVQALINCFRLSNDIVAVEGVMHNDDLPSMLLLDPFEIATSDKSNIFSLSGGMIKKLARLCGFEAIFEEGGQADPRCQLGGRGTIVFKKSAEEGEMYPDWIFPVSPIKP